MVHQETEDVRSLTCYLVAYGVLTSYEQIAWSEHLLYSHTPASAGLYAYYRLYGHVGRYLLRTVNSLAASPGIDELLQSFHTFYLGVVCDDGDEPVRVRGRVERGSFTLTLSQNRA